MKSSLGTVERDIVIVQSMRNTIMVASVMASAALLGVMAFVGATHGLGSNATPKLFRLFVGAMALLAVAFSVLALVLLSHASRESDLTLIERDWRRAHSCVMIAGAAFVLFALGALWVAL